ncbi:glycosyltransferase 87 family protein [Yinghuangia soli]|uniref:Glycosyltransferase 87 family protein n=1 Tax=Yinghuangia soli TaxID=2908204 RepID=A0AA41Q7Z5_9ACTN|nr:glycosyltransferase 87 family protein [Yinghuangia soli]MCF2531852.1 glycosyltransferase 87 family protein [Yinghuangia soli]
MSGAAAAWAISLGLWILLLVGNTGMLWTSLDLAVYRGAAESLGHGQDALYTESFGPWPGPFLYPPIAAVFFRAMLVFDWETWKVLTSIVNHLCVLAIAWWSWGMVAKNRTAVRLAATFGTAAVAMWLEPVDKTFRYGQVSLALLALILYDMSRPDGSRTKGIGIGLAAGFKLTPGLFIVYLLLTRRFRAAATATATFAATVAVGFAFLPKAAIRFWFDAISGPEQVNNSVSIADAINQSFRAMFIRLVGADNSTASLLWVAACAITTPILLAAAVQASRRREELLGVLLCGGVTVLVSPISWSHHWVWVLPAAILLAHKAVTAVGRRRKQLFAGLVAYLALMMCYPVGLGKHGEFDSSMHALPYGLVWMTPHQDGFDLTWTMWQSVVGNSLLLANLVLMLGVSLILLRPSALLDKDGVPVFPADAAELPSEARSQDADTADLDAEAASVVAEENAVKPLQTVPDRPTRHL